MVVNLTLDYLNTQLAHYEQQNKNIIRLHETLKQLKLFLKEQPDINSLDSFLKTRQNALKVKLETELLTVQEQNIEEWTLRQLEHYNLTLKQQHAKDINTSFEHIKTLFQSEVDKRTKTAAQIKCQLK